MTEEKTQELWQRMMAACRRVAVKQGPRASQVIRAEWLEWYYRQLRGSRATAEPADAILRD